MHNACCSRRGLIRGTLASLAASGLSWPAEAVAAAEPADDTLRYISRPDLRPPKIAIRRLRTVPAAPRYFLLAAEQQAGACTLLMLDSHGDVAWCVPMDGELAKDLNVQSYRGRPVLTWWESIGWVGDQSMGQGVGRIADSSYSIIATVAAGDGLQADFHELNLTSRGTALITAYHTRRADLSMLGGPVDGYVWSGVAQEIDIATGEVVFEWDSLDHVAPAETMSSLTGGTEQTPFGYFHINSIAVAHDDDLLISARNTCTVYKVDRASGAIKWRLGGSQSDFTMGPGTTFWWQHCVREPAPNVLSIFDDGGLPKKERHSRGILLDLDTAGMRATLSRSYPSPAGLLASNQGSMQLLDDHRVLIGWGSEPAFTEFADDGTELLNGQMPAGYSSYRAYAADWTGMPKDRPAAVARRTRSGAVVYVSWNGATEVASWQLYAGVRETRLIPVITRRKTSFETAIVVRRDGPYFRVDALDADGRVLGESGVVRC
jgi:hypothetical protein